VLADDRVVSGSGDCTVRVWDLASGKQQRAFMADAPVSRLAVNKANRLVAGCFDGTFHTLSWG
jgi:WD40 repeat protein